MEVHHHAHTARKKWTHYFWEFLMLFLAVFCGFLAEYQLEHKIEKERGKQYAASFREDLCKDTSVLLKGLEQMKRSSRQGDFLVKIIQEENTQSPAMIKRLYEYNITTLAGFGMPMTDRTETQLKNSGGMRLIAKKPVIDGIIDYWAGKSAITQIEAIIQEMRVKARDLSYTIFDNKYYSENAVNGKREVKADAVLLKKDPFALTEFCNRIAHLKNLMKGTYTTYLKNQLAKADTLIQVIDKLYHLK
ncbi:MAG: hypothetical protein SGI83_11385 [Bacteroidota bacterium]|nr:hypothetical protein [Bacteroidota bacterium]